MALIFPIDGPGYARKWLQQPALSRAMIADLQRGLRRTRTMNAFCFPIKGYSYAAEMDVRLLQLASMFH